MNRKTLFVQTLAVQLLLALAGTVLIHPTRARSENANASPTAVTIDNFTFQPGGITVPVNSTVTWTNKDDVPHVVASNDGLFKSKALDTDDKYTYTFTKPGTYAYYCTIHPKMVAKIVVQ